MLLDLPPELLRCVLDRCGPRTLAAAACACKALGAAAKDPDRRLAVFVRKRGPPPRWLRAWSHTVAALKSYGPVLRGRCIPVSWLENLRHLHVSCTTIDDRLIESLPPGLESLHLRKVRPHAFFDELRTRRFDRLAGTLRHLSLALGQDWTRVSLDHRRLRLDALVIEGAPAIRLQGRMPPVERRLHLCAVDALESSEGDDDAQHGALPLAPWTRIRVMETDVREELFDAATLGHVAYFSVSCPWKTWVGCLGRMSALRELHLQLDSVTIDVPQMRSLPHLKKVRIRSRFSYGFLHDRAIKLPAGVDAELYVNGYRLPPCELSEHRCATASAAAPSAIIRA